MTRHHRTLARTRVIAAIIAALAVLAGGCATSPPSNVNNACAIFTEKDDWYDAAKDAEEKWGVPVHLQLAFLHQESRFRHDAKPPRTRLLWVIPWKRKSSAFGYSQALDSTWEWYQDETGNHGADRDDFEDVTDFIGWYGHMSHRVVGIAKDDAYSQYLAYHEGPNGFRRGTYRSKPGLRRIARRVANNATRYRRQLASCQAQLKRGPWWWPF